MKGRSIMTVAKWFVEKNYSRNEAQAMAETEATIERETEKAYLLKYNTEYGVITGWFPKSVCSEETIEAAQTELKAGDKVTTKDGKKLTVVSTDGQFATLSNKKMYVCSMLTIA